MARFIKYLKFLVLMLPLMVMAACSDKNDGGEEMEHSDLSTIVVSRSSMVLPPGMEELERGEVLPIINNDFQPADILYLSQMGTQVDPSFQEGAPNLYLYEYYENEEETPTWDQGYNFRLASGSNSLTWSNVVNLGSVGNAFSFYAMYFPGKEVSFTVQPDQTGGSTEPYDESNFIKSDILGAYHTTSATYTRLRFNLFHLMVYLKVTVYVPDYTDEYNPEEGEAKFSGFKEGALQEAYVLNAAPAFSIAWRTVVSSDAAPNTQTTGSNTNIKMYMHEPDSEIIENFPVTDYYNGGEITTDAVRAYNFSVLFPSQAFAQNSNMLCFVLKNPVGDNAPDKYYYFSTNQLMSQTASYAFSSGSLHNLYLYLPRSTNKTILLGANILDWGNTSTEMTVTTPSTSEYDEN